jgi:hypothetical protein
MFTKDDLIEQCASFVESTTPIESILFEPDDFPSSSSEETISIYRGLKSNFENPVHFWIRAHLSQDQTKRMAYLMPYLHSALYKPVEEQEFMQRLSQADNLKNIMIKPKGKYLQGLKMIDEWNDFSAIAEFEQEYLSFDWDTTA